MSPRRSGPEQGKSANNTVEQCANVKFSKLFIVGRQTLGASVRMKAIVNGVVYGFLSEGTKGGNTRP